jgi:hypothetical protein
MQLFLPTMFARHPPFERKFRGEAVLVAHLPVHWFELKPCRKKQLKRTPTQTEGA